MKISTGCFWKCICIVILACLFLGGGAGHSHAAQVTLAWDAHPDPSVAGYKLYYGKTSRTYGAPVDVGKNTRYIFTGIEEGKTSYFAVTAYDTRLYESAFSAELECFTLVPDADDNGAISPGSTVVVSRGMSRVFTISPEAGYQVKNVFVDGVSVGALTSYPFSNVTASHTISARFNTATLLDLNFEEGSGRTALDSSVSGNTGTIYGAVYSTDSAIGTYALSFDGNDCVIVPADASLKPSNLSVAFWVKHTSDTSSSYGGIIQGAYGNGYARGFGVLDYQNKPLAQMNFGDADPIEISGRSFVQGVWTHVVLTYDHQKISLYQNGALVREISETRNINWAENDKNLTIGLAQQLYFKGMIDKVQMRDFAYSPQTVQVLYLKKNSVPAVAERFNSFSNVQADHSVSATIKQRSTTRKTSNQNTDAASSHLLAGSGGWIEVLTPQGKEGEAPVRIGWPEYNRLSGELRIAAGDIDGDGRDEIVVGLGRVKEAPGIPGGYFAVLDDDFSVLAWGRVEWPEYNDINGETRPACGDIDGDGIAEIIVGLGPGGEGRMEVFKLVDHQLKHVKWLQAGWQDYNRGNGEMRPACGDLDGDGTDEVIAGLGPIQGNSEVPGGVFLIFDASSTGSDHLRDSRESDVAAWGRIGRPDYNRVNGESWPACGDVNGDGRDEIVLGLGKEAAGRFEILGFDLSENRTQHLAWQQSTLPDGVHPACGRLAADAADQIVIGSGMDLMEIFGDAKQNYQPVMHIRIASDAPRKTGGRIWPAVMIRAKDSLPPTLTGIDP